MDETILDKAKRLDDEIRWLGDAIKSIQSSSYLVAYPVYYKIPVSNELNKLITTQLEKELDDLKAEFESL